MVGAVVIGLPLGLPGATVGSGVLGLLLGLPGVTLGTGGPAGPAAGPAKVAVGSALGAIETVVIVGIRKIEGASVGRAVIVGTFSSPNEDPRCSVVGAEEEEGSVDTVGTPKTVPSVVRLVDGLLVPATTGIEVRVGLTSCGRKGSNIGTAGVGLTLGAVGVEGLGVAVGAGGSYTTTGTSFLVCCDDP